MVPPIVQVSGIFECPLLSQLLLKFTRSEPHSLGTCNSVINEFIQNSFSRSQSLGSKDTCRKLLNLRLSKTVYSGV